MINKLFYFVITISIAGFFLFCEKRAEEEEIGEIKDTKEEKKEIVFKEDEEYIEDIIYECEKTQDCPDDENKCNGIFVCKDKKCIIDETTIVICDKSKDTECIKTECNEKTGECEKIVVEDGVECNDGKPCTIDDECVNGECTGLLKECDDFNPCTIDDCEEGEGKCINKKEKDGTPCEDDDPCTINSFCKNGECVSNTFQYNCCWINDDCDDLLKCTKELCNKEKNECSRSVVECAPSEDSCKVNLCGMNGECNPYEIGGYETIYLFDMRNFIPEWLFTDPDKWDPDIDLFLLEFAGDGVKVKEKDVIIVFPIVKLPEGNLLMRINGKGAKDCTSIDVLINNISVKGNCIKGDEEWSYNFDVSSLPKDFQLKLKLKDTDVLLRSVEIISIGLNGCPQKKSESIDITDGVKYFDVHSYRDKGILIWTILIEKNAKIKWLLFDVLSREGDEEEELGDKFLIPDEEFKIETTSTDDKGFSFSFGGIGYEGEKNAYIVFLDKDGGVKAGPIQINQTGSGVNPSILDLGENTILVCLSGSKINTLDNDELGIGCILMTYEGIKKGGIFPLNKSDIKGSQDHTEIAKLNNENILFLWDSKENGGKKIWGKILDKNFSVKKEEISLLGGEEGEYEKPSLLTLENSNLFIVYNFKNKEGDDDIHATIIDENLNILKNDFTINQKKEGGQKNPIILKGLENAIILWEGENGKIYKRYFNIDGSPLGDEFMVSEESKGVHGNIFTATNGGIFWINEGINKIQYSVIGLGCYKGEIYCEGKKPYGCNGYEYKPLIGECKGKSCIDLCK